MDKYRYKMVLDKQRIERKQIWTDAEKFGEQTAYADVLSFFAWFNADKNPDLHEMRFYIESRLNPIDETISPGKDVSQ